MNKTSTCVGAVATLTLGWATATHAMNLMPLGDSIAEGLCANGGTTGATADCLAGAFTEQAGRDSSLEKGDIAEAFFGMSLAGDPTPEPTGNVRYDSMVQARLARQSHGTKEQRTTNFRTGLDGGARACLADFR